MAYKEWQSQQHPSNLKDGYSTYSKAYQAKRKRTAEAAPNLYRQASGGHSPCLGGVDLLTIRLTAEDLSVSNTLALSG